MITQARQTIGKFAADFADGGFLQRCNAGRDGAASLQKLPTKKQSICPQNDAEHAEKGPDE
jgi:hypothetical protein